MKLPLFSKILYVIKLNPYLVISKFIEECALAVIGKLISINYSCLIVICTNCNYGIHSFISRRFFTKTCYNSCRTCLCLCSGISIITIALCSRSTSVDTCKLSCILSSAVYIYIGQGSLLDKSIVVLTDYTTCYRLTSYFSIRNSYPADSAHICSKSSPSISQNSL